MINKPLPFEGLKIRLLIITPSEGRGFIHQGSTLFGSILGSAVCGTTIFKAYESGGSQASGVLVLGLSVYIYI